MATAQERAQAIWWYAETNSVIQVQRNFRRVFQKDPPSRNTIKTWKQHFLATESVVKLHGCGHVRVSEERVAAVRQAYFSPKLNVWCGLMHNLIIGPFFFAEQTVTRNTYLDMLDQFVVPQLMLMQPNVIFQQDGAPPHWSLIVREFLDTQFPGRWIGRGGPTRWPPRSPDITPLDFLLWGYVKNKVYTGHKIRDLQQLRGCIRDAVNSVTHEMLQKTWKEIKFRLDVLRATRGSHVEAKTKAWKEFCSSQSPQNPWGIIYKMCRKPENFNRSLNTIQTDNGFTSNTYETASVLINKFFPDDSIDTDMHKRTRLESELSPDTEDEPQFTAEEVERAIKKLNDKKAPGIDAISANIIKNIHTSCADLFVSIFNKCMSLQVFPDCWKIANVKIIPKPHCHNRTANAYRPICLLPVMGKLLEKLIIDRIMYNLYNTNMLKGNQYGFTPQKSTEDAVLHVVNWANQTLRRRQFGLLISLDISGAFHNAWWPKIMSQLKKKGCPRNLYNLVKNYFSNRKVQLTIGTTTLMKDVNKGCPQGSCCSPGLWNILYDDLLQMDLPNDCQLIAYADDAQGVPQVRIIGDIIKFVVCAVGSTRTCRNRWIGRRGPSEWSPMSPDLSPHDFALWQACQLMPTGASARFRAQESLSALQRKGKRQTKEVLYAAWSSYIQELPALIQ
ncbi:hypothetical protein ANN_11841 [Periplaneta americana]|uniref:Reverse transcriptase domain-containing protein n=1 Tax=Periplaneta americana TaxID=6978 RepID=A0ABQ8T7Z7_PERAM|nr:hypothetical protein ANN_11841 [Periplaneta americana]